MLDGFGGKLSFSSIGRAKKRGSSAFPFAHAQWDFRNPETRFQDTEKTIPARDIGDPVAVVVDITGNGYDLIAPSSANRPTVSEHNGVQCISCAAGQFIVTSGGVLDSQDMSISFSAHKTVSTSQSNHGNRYQRWMSFFVGSDSDGVYADANINAIRAKFPRVSGSDNRPKISNFDSVAPVGEGFYIVSENGMDYGNIRLKGIDKDGESNNGTSFTHANNTLVLGYTTVGDYFSAIVVDREISHYERVNLEHYLADSCNVERTFQPTYIAHRGMKGCWTEGSEIAFYNSAQNLGIRMWEADLRPSADGTPWVFKDDQVNSLTNGSGNFSDLSDSYLESITLNGGYDLLKLSELLALGKHLNATLFLEIKSLGDIGVGFIDSIYNMITVADLKNDQVILHSSNVSDVQRVRALSSSFPVGIAHSVPSQALVHAASLGGVTYAIIQFDGVYNNQSILDAAQQMQVPIIVWGTDDFNKVQELGDKVQYYITDFPLNMVKVQSCPPTMPVQDASLSDFVQVLDLSSFVQPPDLQNHDTSSDLQQDLSDLTIQEIQDIIENYVDDFQQIASPSGLANLLRNLF